MNDNVLYQSQTYKRRNVATGVPRRALAILRFEESVRPRSLYVCLLRVHGRKQLEQLGLDLVPPAAVVGFPMMVWAECHNVPHSIGPLLRQRLHMMCLGIHTPVCHAEAFRIT